MNEDLLVKSLQSNVSVGERGGRFERIAGRLFLFTRGALVVARGGLLRLSAFFDAYELFFITTLAKGNLSDFVTLLSVLHLLCLENIAFAADRHVDVVTSNQ